jgi:hypothetical protein
MSDPAYAIQVALVAALRAVDTEVENRVFDTVPDDADFPYASLGDGQVIPVDEDCGDPSETYVDVNVWTRDVGFPQTKRIAGAYRERLHHGELTIVGHVVDLMEVQTVNYVRDPDGITRHGILSVLIRTTPTA